MAQPWSQSWEWSQDEHRRWWDGWHKSPSGLWEHADRRWSGRRDDGYRRAWAHTRFIGPASNNAQAAGEAAVAAEDAEWNETLQQWEEASNWSAPADEPDRFAFNDGALRSQSEVIADADEAGYRDWGDADDADENIR